MFIFGAVAVVCVHLVLGKARYIALCSRLARFGSRFCNVDFKNTIRMACTHFRSPIIIHSIQKQSQECVRVSVCVFVQTESCG